MESWSVTWEAFKLNVFIHHDDPNDSALSKKSNFIGIGLNLHREVISFFLSWRSTWNSVLVISTLNTLLILKYYTLSILLELNLHISYSLFYIPPGILFEIYKSILEILSQFHINNSKCLYCGEMANRRSLSKGYSPTKPTATQINIHKM